MYNNREVARFPSRYRFGLLIARRFLIASFLAIFIIVPIAFEAAANSFATLMCPAGLNVVQSTEGYEDISACTKKDGVKEGSAVIVNSSGIATVVGQYSNGLRTGRWYDLDENGRTNAYRTYIDGKLSGESTEYSAFSGDLSAREYHTGSQLHDYAVREYYCDGQRGLSSFDTKGDLLNNRITAYFNCANSNALAIEVQADAKLVGMAFWENGQIKSLSLYGYGVKGEFNRYWDFFGNDFDYGSTVGGCLSSDTCSWPDNKRTAMYYFDPCHNCFSSITIRPFEHNMLAIRDSIVDIIRNKGNEIAFDGFTNRRLIVVSLPRKENDVEKFYRFRLSVGECQNGNCSVSVTANVISSKNGDLIHQAPASVAAPPAAMLSDKIIGDDELTASLVDYFDNALTQSDREMRHIKCYREPSSSGC